MTVFEGESLGVVAWEEEDDDNSVIIEMSRAIEHFG